MPRVEFCCQNPGRGRVMCVGGEGGSCLIIGQMPRPVGHFDKMKLAHGVVHKPHRAVGLEDE